MTTTQQKNIRAALVDAGVPIDTADELASSLAHDLMTPDGLRASLDAKADLLADLVRRTDAHGRIHPPTVEPQIASGGNRPPAGGSTDPLLAAIAAAEAAGDTSATLRLKASQLHQRRLDLEAQNRFGATT